MKIFELIFSPTGGTKKVADILANALGNKIEIVDLMCPTTDFTSISISDEALCIIAVPAYSGRVPAIAVSRIAKLCGNHAQTVLTAVYGNRAFDDTLLELKEVAVAAGFNPIAAIGAVAEHSLAHQYGAGRPDAEDQSELENFAEKILSVISDKAAAPLQLPGNYPYRKFNGVPAKPIANESCSSCGLCASQCPVGAIPEEHPEQTNNDLCISCMRCVAVCPQQAKQIHPYIAATIAKNLAAVCADRKNNTLYL